MVYQKFSSFSCDQKIWKLLVITIVWVFVESQKVCINSSFVINLQKIFIALQNFLNNLLFSRTKYCLTLLNWNHNAFPILNEWSDVLAILYRKSQRGWSRLEESYQCTFHSDCTGHNLITGRIGCSASCRWIYSCTVHSLQAIATTVLLIWFSRAGHWRDTWQ